MRLFVKLLHHDQTCIEMVFVFTVCGHTKIEQDRSSSSSEQAKREIGVDRELDMKKARPSAAPVLRHPTERAKQQIW